MTLHPFFIVWIAFFKHEDKRTRPCCIIVTLDPEKLRVDALKLLVVPFEVVDRIFMGGKE